MKIANCIYYLLTFWVKRWLILNFEVRWLQIKVLLAFYDLFIRFDEFIAVLFFAIFCDQFILYLSLFILLHALLLFIIWLQILEVSLKVISSRIISALPIYLFQQFSQILQVSLRGFLFGDFKHWFHQLIQI